MKTTLRAIMVSAALALLLGPALAQTDPLPSWNDGAVKSAIMDFVDRATAEDTPDYVEPAERIATFDNDGTLWVEQPVYSQFLFARDHLRAMAPQHPDWQTTEPYKSVLEGDVNALADLSLLDIEKVIAATHSGMTVDAFKAAVLDWITTSEQPLFHRPYTEVVYQPMLELMAYLRENGFKTFIVSGGGVDFMRPWADTTYGVPPEQVVGTYGELRFQIGADGIPELIKGPGIAFMDDGPGKPVAISRLIGRHPIAAFGNSDGDIEMLQYTAGGPGAHFVAFVHHDDPVREVAYDRDSRVGRLDKGLDMAAAKGWPLISMKNDWKVIFPPAR